MKTAIRMFVPLFLLLSIGCATANIEKMVPQESAMYIQIPDSQALLVDVDAMMQDFGLSAMYEGVELEEFLNSALSASGQVFDLTAFDLERPAGMAILPQNESFDSLSFMAFLPISEEGIELDLAEWATNPPDSYAMVYKDYLILASDEQLLDNFPPKEREDISVLRNYSPSSVQLLVDMHQYIDQMDFLSKIRNQMSQSLEEQPVVISQLIERYFGILEELTNVSMAVSYTNGAFEVASTVDFDGRTGRFISTLEPAESLDDYPILSLPSSMYALSASISQKNSSQLNSMLIDSMRQDISAENLEAYKSTVQQLVALGTGRMSVSFDISPKIESDTGDDKGKQELPMNFSLVSAVETQDAEQYLQLYLESQEQFAEIISSVGDAGDASAQAIAGTELVAGTTPGGLDFYTLNNPAMAEVEQTFGFQMFVFVLNNELVTYVGNESPKILDSIAYQPSLPGISDQDIMRGQLNIADAQNLLVLLGAGLPSIPDNAQITGATYLQDGKLMSRFWVPRELIQVMLGVAVQ